MRLHHLLLLVVLIGGLAWGVAGSADKPFEGGYLLVGDVKELLKGQRIVIEDFLSPTCSNCYLFWKNRQPFGEDVETRTSYVFDADHGELAARLLLVARAQGGDLETKTLTALYTARFEAKVNTEDDEVVDALAASLGLGAAWAQLEQAPETNRQLNAMQQSRKERCIDRAPHFIINRAISVTGGTCRCTGDELPAVLTDILKKLRAYRAASPAK